MNFKKSLKKNIQPYIFLSPFILLVSVLYILPAILTIIMSFTSLDRAFIWEFNGFNNYLKIVKDPNTPQIILNTVVFVGVTIILTLILQIILSTLTTYFIKNGSMSSMFKLILMIPMITPSVVYSVLWIWLLDATDNGVLNQVMMSVFGAEPINWIAQYPFQVIIIAQLMTSIAYGTTIFSSAIKSIPEVQFKAARVDGAGELEIIRNIIIPNLVPHIKFIVLWETLGLLTNYINIMLITNGGPGIQTEVWALSAYHKAFTDGQYGYGAAISVVLIVVVVLLMLMIMRLSNTKKGAKNV